MFIDVKPRILEIAVQDLLAYSIYPDPVKLKQTVQAYESNSDWQLYGLESEGELVGLIGCRMEVDKRLFITHLAVEPDQRGQGFGRGLILEGIELWKPMQVLAETDEDAVDFYRNIGFTIESLGEKYPGVERFLCTYDAEL